LLELVVEERKGFLVGADFTEAHVTLDLAAIVVAIEFSALFLNFRLGLLLHFLGGDRGLAAGDFDEFGRLFVGHAAGVPGQRPHHPEPDASAYDKRRRERPVKCIALGDQKREVGCAH
jgi:hypothetical protein